jgi:L-lactate permease
VNRYLGQPFGAFSIEGAKGFGASAAISQLAKLKFMDLER